MASKLIVALDYHNQRDALHLVEQLDPMNCALKVGSELFTLLGASFVTRLIERQFKVFLDLKFHDIPNTVANACKAAADMGVWMVNVHASGGFNMMAAAKKALDDYGQNKPLLIAVTVLTSFTEDDLVQTGINTPLMEQVKNLAYLARDAGLDGVVSSAHEVKLIKQICGTEFVTVTPGIRLAADGTKDDQSRVMTPVEAVQEGSDFLVIGRPITRAVNPGEVVRTILDELRLID